MSRVIAISLEKGGSAKTTTAVNLAAALSQAGRRVLLIDGDSQGHVSQHLGINPEHGLASFVAAKVDAAAAVHEARPGLYVMAGGKSLVGLGVEIARAAMRSEETIARAMRPLTSLFDYILIDTPPGYTPLLINILFFADELLLPVPMQALSITGLLTFIEKLGEIQQYHDLKLSYVLPVNLDRRYAQTGEYLDQLQVHFSGSLCEPIRTDVRLSEAPAHGETIFEYAADSKGAADYKALAKRIMKDE